MAATSVYRYYDAASILIYVGITARGTTRNSEHNRHREWWPLVDRQDVEHFPSREAAHAREVELIQRHRPPFNTQHNPEAAQMRAAYLAVAPTVALAADHERLAKECGRVIPLTEIPGTGDVRLFRTAVEHASIAVRIGHVSGVKVTTDLLGGVGRVVGIEQQGPVALIRACVRRSVTFSAVSADVKILAHKGGPAYALRRVKLSEAVIAA